MNVSPKAILQVTIFVLFLVAAIVLGDWVISGLIGIPVDKAPIILRAPVHAISLGIVIYGGIKFFGRGLG